jgi:hypothetical protein
MWREIDPVAAMQTQIARLYRKRHNMGIREFLDLDRKVNILGYLEIGYEPFHLTGDEGILDEVDYYCRKRLAQGGANEIANE